MNHAITTALLVVTALVFQPGCDDGPESPAEQLGAGPPPPARLQPQYAFRPGVCDDYRPVCNFIRGFLETCLAGDYETYRAMVSRTRLPETREQFEAIFEAVARVEIKEIRPVEQLSRLGLDELTDEAYVVISAIDFAPESRVSLRGEERDVAILVLREQGELRMLPAPSALQPRTVPAASQPATQPTTSAPSYPWDEDVDY